MSAELGLIARAWLAMRVWGSSWQNLYFVFLAYSLLDVYLFAIGASRADGEYIGYYRASGYRWMGVGR